MGVGFELGLYKINLPSNGRQVSACDDGDCGCTAAAVPWLVTVIVEGRREERWCEGEEERVRAPGGNI